MARRAQWLQQNVNYLKVLSNSSELIEIHPNLKEIYSLAEFERMALAILPSGTRAFFNNGADCENSKRENEAAFSRFVFIPRIFENSPRINLRVELFGTTFQLPIGIAPTGLQRLAHRDGEIASAVSDKNKFQFFPSNPSCRTEISSQFWNSYFCFSLGNYVNGGNSPRSTRENVSLDPDISVQR